MKLPNAQVPPVAIHPLQVAPDGVASVRCKLGEIPQHPQSYASSKGGLMVAGYVDMSIPFAAGGLYSTTEDLLRWEEGLYGGKLLSMASLKKMTTSFKDDYAFGVAVDRDAVGNAVIWQRGAIEGFSAYLI